MTDEMKTLGQRAVDCKGWRWMPGMLVACRDRYILRTCQVSRNSFVGVTATGHAFGWRKKGIPDLTDPATLGCLLALVREAWGDDSFYVCRSGPFWVVRNSRGDVTGEHDTEAEALVAALEDAP